MDALHLKNNIDTINFDTILKFEICNEIIFLIYAKWSNIGIINMFYKWLIILYDWPLYSGFEVQAGNLDILPNILQPDSNSTKTIVHIIVYQFNTEAELQSVPDYKIFAITFQLPNYTLVDMMAKKNVFSIAEIRFTLLKNGRSFYGTWTNK